MDGAFSATARTTQPNSNNWVRLRSANPNNARLNPTQHSRFALRSAPYHHRLSWEVWIHVTASKEHLATRYLADQVRRQNEHLTYPDTAAQVQRENQPIKCVVIRIQ